MSSKVDKFSKELDDLIIYGDRLYLSMTYTVTQKEFVAALRKTLSNEEAKNFIEELPDFKSEYQSWFSKAQVVVRQILPYRLDDFNSFYEYPKSRKEISFQNYMIKDALQGLGITDFGGEIVVDQSAALPEFAQQINIVKAAKGALASKLFELKSILQADLFDGEIESAGVLAKAGYLRAAGAICGVILEKHLIQVCETHKIKISKKNPTINDLNQALKDNDTITVPQWRFNQQLADIRNICDHAKGREPTGDEIDDLLLGTAKVLKTIF